MSNQPTPGQILPDLNVPDLNVPDLNVPDLNVPDLNEEEALHYRAIIRQLVDIGMEMITGLGAAAETPKPDQSIPYEAHHPAPSAAASLLARKLAEPLPAPASDPKPNRTAARKRIIREVEDTIQRDIWDEPPDRDALHSELLERLDSPDLEQEISLRDVPDIVKDILRDLGLAHMPGTHPWKRRTPKTSNTSGPKPPPHPNHCPPHPEKQPLRPNEKGPHQSLGPDLSQTACRLRVRTSHPAGDDRTGQAQSDQSQTKPTRPAPARR